MRTKVFITIDTEFNVGGAFADPIRNTPVGPQSVMCDIDGKSHGLGFLLDTFSNFGTKATFFVETFNSYYFGDQPMRDLASWIKTSGHDVQLHLHPCWTYFRNADWIDRLKTDPPTDHMYGRDPEQLNQWLLDGIAIFERWGLGRPVALRSGNLMADRELYKAMERAGIHIGSNIGLAVYRPQDSGLDFFSGFHRLGNVVEVCVLTYIDFQIGGKVHYKTLTITGSSWQETRTLLLRAHESNVAAVVVLTHAFEYVKRLDDGFIRLRPNRMNQQRLIRLCEFLRDHSDRFEVATFGALEPSLAQLPFERNVVLKVPLARAAERFVQNTLNDRIRTL
jgi:hypothetical protein